MFLSFLVFVFTFFGGTFEKRDEMCKVGIMVRSKDATRGSWPYYWEQGRYYLL